MIKVLVEIEPVLLQGTITDKQYYGFRILGLNSHLGEHVIATTSCAQYPGNDAVRGFINSKVKEQS